MQEREKLLPILSKYMITIKRPSSTHCVSDNWYPQCHKLLEIVHRTSIHSMIIAWQRELLFRTSAMHKTDDFTPFPCVGRKCKLKHIRLIGRIYLQIITIRKQGRLDRIKTKISIYLFILCIIKLI